MKLVYVVVALWTIVGVVGCTGEDVWTQTASTQTLIGIGDDKLTSADFEAYLKLKGIPTTPGNRRDRALKTFRERNALAKLVANDPLIDKTAVEAEVRDFRNELLIRRYFETFLKDKVSNEAMQAYYQANLERYSRGKARIAHILFRIHRAMGEQQALAKFNQAVETHAKLKGGAPFAKLAEQLSEDPLTAKKGGEVGWVQAGQIDNTLFDKAISMKKGEVSEPIRTDKGYQILLALDDPVTEQRPFQDVKGEIQYRLRYEAEQAEMKRLLSQITAKNLR